MAQIHDADDSLHKGQAFPLECMKQATFAVEEGCVVPKRLLDITRNALNPLIAWCRRGRLRLAWKRQNPFSRSCQQVRHASAEHERGAQPLQERPQAWAFERLESDIGAIVGNLRCLCSAGC